MKAVIINGGAVKDYSYIKTQINKGDTIICADSGYNHAVKMGLTPDIIVGDFDSIKNMPDNIPRLRYPARKDLTDAEIAVDYARGKGFKDILLLAATGNRLDHTLTNIFLLKNANGLNISIIDEHNKITLTDSHIEINEPIGSIISLVPLSDCRGVTTKNLEYPLCNAELLVGKGLGVSNIMTENNAAVSVDGGLLLVIAARD